MIQFCVSSLPLLQCTLIPKDALEANTGGKCILSVMVIAANSSTVGQASRSHGGMKIHYGSR